LKENAMSKKEVPYSKVKKMLEGIVYTLGEKKEYLNRLDAEIGGYRPFIWNSLHRSGKGNRGKAGDQAGGLVKVG